MYRLLATLLSAPPLPETLDELGRLTGDGTALGVAVSGLAESARSSDTSRISDEYQEVFIGVGRGEVVPFASYYLTGFLHERPLLQLRQDLERLGIESDRGVSEPEDHAAAILELMAGLIDGAFGEPVPVDRQKDLYARHVAPWLPSFFRDLEAAPSAVFYASVAAVGVRFLEIEAEAFRMV